MKDESVLAVRIRENYSIFSKSEKKIADFLLANIEFCADATAKDIADKTDTSAATVVRFSRMLGFEGVSDMKRFLLMNRPHRSAKKMLADENHAQTLTQRTFQYNEECVGKVYEQLDRSILEAAAKELMGAKFIFLAGMGGSSSSLWCAYDAFQKIGLPCALLMDPFFQVMTLSGVRNPKQCVLLCICHSGRVKDVIDTMQVAKAKGIKTIALVGYAETPMKQYTDIQILTGANEHPVFSDTMAARICELNVLSVIYAYIVQQMGKDYDGIRDAVNKSINMKRL